MPDPGPINPSQLEGFGHSSGSQFGAVLMSDGEGRCFWAYVDGWIDSIGGADADEAFTLTIGGADAFSSFPTTVGGLGA